MCRHDLTHKFSICLAIMAYEFEFECDLAGGPMNFEYVNRPRNYLAKRQKSVC